MRYLFSTQSLPILLCLLVLSVSCKDEEENEEPTATAEVLLAGEVSKTWQMPLAGCPTTNESVTFSRNGFGLLSVQGADGCCCLDTVDIFWVLSGDKRRITITTLDSGNDWVDELVFEIKSISENALSVRVFVTGEDNNDVVNWEYLAS